MKLPALSFANGAGMHIKYSLAYFALPVTCALLGALALAGLAAWLTGTSWNGKLPDWHVLAKFALVIGPVAIGLAIGVYLGAGLNLLIATHVLGWPKDRIDLVFWTGRAPADWLDTDWLPPSGPALIAAQEKWQRDREIGPLRFIAKYGLGWGLWMFCILSLIPQLINWGDHSPWVLATGAAIWMVGGVWFGWWRYYREPIPE
jgi:hypothetical protein